MAAMLLTPPTVTAFCDWVQSLDPGFTATCLSLGRVRVVVRVVEPDGTRIEVHQNQTMDAQQNPDLTWTVTVN